jgi:hypothetical protein
MAEAVDKRGARQPDGGVLVGGARRAAATAIAGVMLLAAFSLWTVIPFGWIWVGSKISNTQAPSSGPYAVVFIGIVGSILGVVLLLAWLNRLYEHLIGSTEIQIERVRLWRSLSDERNPKRHRWSLLEAVILSSVIAALAAMGIWFFVLAGSPLPNGGALG